MTVEELFSGIAASYAAGRRADALDLLYDTVDDHCLAGEFEWVAAALREGLSRWTAGKLQLAAALSIITVTYPWRKRQEIAAEWLALAAAADPDRLEAK